MSQQIQFYPGQRLSGVYFFGTCDYLNFNDYAEIELVGEPNSILLMHIDISDVGSHSSNEGWQRFKYTFTEETAGQYDLTFTVRDMVDRYFESYLAVDGLSICDSPPPYGDINYDCHVDIFDFALLAADWYKASNDPNISQEETDLDQSGFVDESDLALIGLYWLTGQ